MSGTNNPPPYEEYNDSLTNPAAESDKTQFSADRNTGESEIVLYLKTLPGMLKVAEIVLCVLTMIFACIWGLCGFAWWTSGSAIFNVIANIVIYVTKHQTKQWLIILFIVYCYDVIIFMVLGIVSITWLATTPASGVVVFFSFCTSAVFGVDTYFQYKAWKERQNRPATDGGVNERDGAPIIFCF